jgi:hypothetical protein
MWCAAGDGDEEEDVYIAEGCEGDAAGRQRKGCRLAGSGGSTGWSIEVCCRQRLAWIRGIDSAGFPWRAGDHSQLVTQRGFLFLIKLTVNSQQLAKISVHHEYTVKLNSIALHAGMDGV